MSDKHQHRRKSGGGGGSGKRRHVGGQAKGPVIDKADLRLIDMIVKLGDNVTAATLEGHLNDLVSTLADGSRNAVVLDTVFRCVVAHPCKTAIYAVLLVLLNDSEELARVVLERFRTELAHALRHCDYYAIKFLIRFAVELSNANLIAGAQVNALFETLMECAALGVPKTAFASPGGVMISGPLDMSAQGNDKTKSEFVPQFIGDFYATCIISAALLATNWTPSERVLSLMASHLAHRKSLAWVTPFVTTHSTADLYEGLQIAEIIQSEDDALILLHRHFTAHLADPSKPIRVLQRPYESASISTKLYGASNAMDTASEVLASANRRPPYITCQFEWFDTELLTLRDIFDLVTLRSYISMKNETNADLGLEPLIYPSAVDTCHFTNPQPNCHIFPTERTNGEGKFALAPLERWFVEDYTLDVIHFFRSAHADIPKHISFCRHITDYFDFDALICETVFKDFLRTPASPYPPVHHGVILLDFCQKTPTFSATLAEATERVFGSLTNLSSTATASFVEWFSYHLSNTEFKWTWKEWAVQLHGEAALETHGNGNAESSKTSPASPSPQVRFVQEVLSSIIRLSYYERIAPMIVQAAPGCAKEWLPPKPEASKPVGFYASPLALAIEDEIKHRQKPAEALLEPVMALGTAVPLTSEQLAAVVMRAILVEGSTSITLLQNVLNKYHRVLHQVAFTGLPNIEVPKDGAKHILRACFDYDQASPQHFIIVVLALLHHRIVDAISVVSFLLDPELIAQIEHKLFLWELLAHAVRYVTQARSVLESEIINAWTLSCKSNPDVDPREIAERTKSRTKESQTHLVEFSALLHPLMMTLFTSLIDLMAVSPVKHMIRDQFFSAAIKHRRLVAPVLPALDTLVAGLPQDIQEVFAKLKYFAEHY